VRRFPDRNDSRVESNVGSRVDSNTGSRPQNPIEQRSGTAVRRAPNQTDIARANGGRVDSRGANNYNGGNTGRVAIPRPGPSSQRHDGRYAYGGHSYYSGGRYYTYAPRYYYSPRYYSYRPYYFYRPGYYAAFAFGFGPYGRGYFYYDSFYNSYVFYPRTVVAYYGDSGYYGRPTGSLRLDIEPRDAQVYIDGAYAGLVDDFDGVFQSLRLETGQYHVEVVLPGFESMEFDVYIRPGEKTTYRADMLPERS